MNSTLRSLSVAKLIGFLRLPGVGTARYWTLRNAGIDLNELMESQTLQQAYLPTDAQQVLASRSALLWQRVEQDLDWLNAQPDVSVISIDDAAYPELLREIPKPPPLLYVRGDTRALLLPQIAMVGARNPTAGGLENAERFAAHLAGCGFAITSGLALGVDAAAHHGALQAGGITLAIMGTGIDRIYPARHHTLATDIVEHGGALVSEFPLGTQAQAAHFPQRNRLISGLSMGTLIVEAAVKSGSLITARYALEHNREVFAIPGSIHNPMARGCHQLIREGATLVETADDIVSQLTGVLSYVSTTALRVTQSTKTLDIAVPNQPADALTSVEQQIMDALGFDPLPLDMIAERTNTEVGYLTSILMGLELKGLLVQHGAYYQRV